MGARTHWIPAANVFGRQPHRASTTFPILREALRPSARKEPKLESPVKNSLLSKHPLLKKRTKGVNKAPYPVGWEPCFTPGGLFRKNLVWSESPWTRELIGPLQQTPFWTTAPPRVDTTQVSNRKLSDSGGLANIREKRVQARVSVQADPASF